MEISDPRNTALKRVAAICGILAATVGTVALAGWLTGALFLTSVKTEFIPMAPSTAIVFFLLGLALICHALWRDPPFVRRLMIVSITISLLVSLSLLLQTVIDGGLDLEGIFFESPGVLGNVPTGRMSPITAALFVLAGAVLMLLYARRERTAVTKKTPNNKALQNTALVLSSGIFVAGITISSSYLLSAPLLYGNEAVIPVALPTAIAFTMLGLGLMAETSRRSNVVAKLSAMAPKIEEPGNKHPILVPVGVFLFFAVGITAVGYFAAESQIDRIKSEKQAELAAIGSLKADQIESWRLEVLEDAKLIKDRHLQMEITGEYLDKRDSNSEREVVSLLDSIIENKDFKSASLLDKENRLILSTVSRPPNDIVADAPNVVQEAKRTGIVAISDFHLNAGTGKIEMDIAMPVNYPRSNAGRNDIGIILIEIDPNDFLYPLIKTWPTPSPSAETLLVEKSGDRVLFLNELRHRSNTALELSIPLTRTQVPAVMAVSGRTGVVDGIDYRGVPVLADIHGIEDSPWFVISKIDLEEINAPIRSLIISAYFLVFLLLFITALMLGIWWRSQRLAYYRVIVADQDRQGTLFRLGTTEFKDERELMRDALEQAVRLTDSKIGYFHLFNADKEDFDLYLWTEETLKNCKAEEISHYSLTEAGVWADSVRSGEPVIHNDYQNLAAKKGYPEGHVPVSRHMSVPIRHEGRIIAVAGVGNKELPYNERDVYQSEMFFSSAIKIFLNLRLSKEVEETIKDLKRSNSELEQFAYIASHDLQEPLRMISSFLQLLERRYKGKLDKDADEFIDFSVDGANRLQDMINGLLLYSRVETKGAAFKVIDLNICLANAINNLSLTIKENGAKIIRDKLPKLMGDDNQIMQVFQNLIGNAIKFKSAEPPRIEIGSNNIDGFVEIFVRDNGIGIEQHYDDRIFNIFQRLHGKKYPGSGIGLTICKRIIERHGGEIRFVEVKPDAGGTTVGTTFYFTLPLLKDSQKGDSP